MSTTESLGPLSVDAKACGVIDLLYPRGRPGHGRNQFLKIIGKEFPDFFYKTIFRKINTEESFLPFTIITNKDYFPRKNDYKLNFRKFTVAVVYLWS